MKRTFPLVVSIYRDCSHSSAPSPAPSQAPSQSRSVAAEHIARMGEEAMSRLATARGIAIAAAQTAVQTAQENLQALRVYEQNAEALDLPSAVHIIKEVEQWEAYFHDIVHNEGIFADESEAEPAPAPKGKGKPSKPAPIRKRAPESAAKPATKSAPKKGK